MEIFLKNVYGVIAPNFFNIAKENHLHSLLMFYQTDWCFTHMLHTKLDFILLKLVSIWSNSFGLG